MLNSVVVPADTPQEEIDRLQEEKNQKAEEESKQKVENRIKQLQDEYRRDKDDRFQEGLTAAKWGLLVCILGSLLLRLRYPFGKEEPTP